MPLQHRRYASPRDSSSRVDDSMSVKSSVMTRARCTRALYPTGSEKHKRRAGPAAEPRLPARMFRFRERSRRRTEWSAPG
jgi:hypothetical protein